jgi:hypothetical protein
MPKKTRREKILAEQHRKIHEFVVPSSTPLYAFQPTSGSVQQVSQVEAAEYRATKIDLVKTLLLAAAAISVELLIYLKIGR